jgi:hypothetical protein
MDTDDSGKKIDERYQKKSSTLFFVVVVKDITTMRENAKIKMTLTLLMPVTPKKTKLKFKTGLERLRS